MPVEDIAFTVDDGSVITANTPLSSPGSLTRFDLQSGARLGAIEQDTLGFANLALVDGAHVIARGTNTTIRLSHVQTGRHRMVYGTSESDQPRGLFAGR